jgi:predicted nucleic acid-binding protein
MVPVRFPPEQLLVADASVWINLVAGGKAVEILRALSQPPLITSIALAELERGRDKGRCTAEVLAALIDLGRVSVIDLPPSAEEIYLTLVAGHSNQTLDDGEAATLALALDLGAIALIDERKAINIGTTRFPGLAVTTTTDLLLSPRIRAVLSPIDLSNVLFAALVSARMRVPDHLLDEVRALLGPDRTGLCLSLPARVRNTGSNSEKISA